MWSSDRRKVLKSLAGGAVGLGSALALSSCGFTPVYGPEGGGGKLLNAVALPDPGGDSQYMFNQRFQERLGVAHTGARYRLNVRIQTSEQDIGATSSGNITRIRLIGRAFYSLVDANTAETLHDARTNAFTGFSTTGSTVATRAAQRDALERLMVILADQTIDDLILRAPELPA